MKKLSVFLALVVLLASQAFGVMRYSDSFASLTNAAATATNGTSVNIANVENYSVYWTNTLGPTSSVLCVVEQSPDGSNWFTVDSRTVNTVNSTQKHVVSNTAGVGLLLRARTASSTRVTANVTIYTGSTR